MAHDINPSSLTELRKSLTEMQQTLLNEFWAHYKDHDEWPLARPIHSRYGKELVVSELQPLGGHIVFESQRSGKRPYELGLIGILLTKDGNEYFELIVRYYNHLRSEYLSNPEKLNFTNNDLEEALKLTEAQSALLYNLVNIGSLWSGGGGKAEDWTICPPTEIEDLPRDGDLHTEIESQILSELDQERHVFQSDRPVLTESEILAQIDGTSENTDPDKPLVNDPLKRKYQVFVSSTYEDLKEERQHVIEALLKTKCIPTGMELFPATSTEQWDLIKRVIQECDYYIVIVAGRYGSLGPTGRSYTEMEFDYAVKSGKPVYGFYHPDISALPGKKLEASDSARKQLDAFRKKVRGRMCNTWSSPAELGSAVKSTILDAIEYNPKPGWIRADMAMQMANLEPIEERAETNSKHTPKPKPATEDHFAGGREKIRIAVCIEYDFQETESLFNNGKTTLPTKKLDTEIQLTWNALYLFWESCFQGGTNKNILYRELHSAVRGEIKSALEEQQIDPNQHYNYSFDQVQIDKFLKTFVARKLIKQVANTIGSWETPDYRFTPKGIQLCAELQAIKSENNVI